MDWRREHEALWASTTYTRAHQGVRVEPAWARLDYVKTL